MQPGQLGRAEMNMSVNDALDSDFGAGIGVEELFDLLARTQEQ